MEEIIHVFIFAQLCVFSIQKVTESFSFVGDKNEVIGYAVFMHFHFSIIKTLRLCSIDT